MTTATIPGTVLLVAVNRFMALAIEHDLAQTAPVQRVGWSDEELDAVCERDDIRAVVVDVTFLNEELAVSRLVDLFDCPVVAVKASEPGLRVVAAESSRFVTLAEAAPGWFATIARRT